MKNIKEWCALALALCVIISGVDACNKTQKLEHTHDWGVVIKEVPHKAKGLYKNVLVKEAWTETIPMYETVSVKICNTCGADITNVSIPAHIENHLLAGEDKGGYRTEYRKKQTGTKIVNHPEQYTIKWIETYPAWTEKVVTGHKCSCGATK